MAGDQRSLEATAGLVSSPPHHWRSSPNLSREQTPDSMGTFRQRRHQSPDNRRGYYLPNQQNPENAGLFCQGSLDNESLGGGNLNLVDVLHLLYLLLEQLTRKLLVVCLLSVLVVQGDTGFHTLCFGLILRFYLHHIVITFFTVSNCFNL